MTRSRILAVDDTPAVLAFIRGVLEPAGHQVFVATSGEACLERLPLVEPDLVLLDIMMPGLDGYETCARIKASPGGQGLPVIVLSALAGGFDKAKAFDCGAADFVSKPVDPQELLARVNAHLAMRELDKRRQRDAAELERLVAERTRLLTAALEDREELLRELSHRVENNLQLLLAIIRQQSALDRGGEALLKLASRVEAMALVYEQLSSSKRPEGIDMDEYLKAVVCSTLSTRQDRRIVPAFSLEPLVFPLDQAMPCGLVVNELVANAASHAYGEEGGRVTVSLGLEGGECRLEVRDEGRGSGVRVSEGGGQGLGFRVVAALARQLSATLEEGQDGGGWYRLSFALPRLGSDYKGRKDAGD